MSQFFSEFLANSILWVSVLAWAIASFIKVFLGYMKHGKIDTKLFTSTGGMPSSHSAFVVSLSSSIGITKGFNSDMFALSAVLSIIVMSDAAGIRRAAGYHAEVINDFVSFFEKQGFKVDKKLKELLGHTPIEVAAGALLGILVSALCIK